MLLTTDMQMAIRRYLRETGDTYLDLCSKIGPGEHERSPNPSTISRWLSGKVVCIRDTTGERLLRVIGMEIPEPGLKTGLSPRTLEMAKRMEFLPPPARLRIRQFIESEMTRHIDNQLAHSHALN